MTICCLCCRAVSAMARFHMYKNFVCGRCLTAVPGAWDLLRRWIEDGHPLHDGLAVDIANIAQDTHLPRGRTWWRV